MYKERWMVEGRGGDYFRMYVEESAKGIRGAQVGLLSTLATWWKESSGF